MCRSQRMLFSCLFPISSPSQLPPPGPAVFVYSYYPCNFASSPHHMSHTLVLLVTSPQFVHSIYLPHRAPFRVDYSVVMCFVVRTHHCLPRLRLAPRTSRIRNSSPSSISPFSCSIINWYPLTYVSPGWWIFRPSSGLWSTVLSIVFSFCSWFDHCSLHSRVCCTRGRMSSVQCASCMGQAAVRTASTISLSLCLVHTDVKCAHNSLEMPHKDRPVSDLITTYINMMKAAVQASGVYSLVIRTQQPTDTLLEYTGSLL